MKLNEMKNNEEVLAEQLRDDPEFRAEWERTALARAVSVTLVGWRSERDLTQRELADLLGMKQPQVARLERGDVNPGMDTLMRLAAGLGIEFTIDVHPAKATARNVTKQAQSDSTVGGVETEDARVVVLASA